MPVEYIDPPGLAAVAAYRHVSVGTGSRTVSVAGQVAVSDDGAVVADDLASQVAQCYGNIQTALAGAGCGFDDVVRLTVYVVAWTPDQMPALLSGIERARTTYGITALPPITLIGVMALAASEYLVEVEATAIVN